MEIPHHVFHEMENKFGELKPLFIKFAHTHISPKEIEKIVNEVDQGLATNALTPHSKPYKSSASVKKAINATFRSVTGDKRLEEIKEVYLRSCEKYKKTFLNTVNDWYEKEITNPDFDTSWRDFTALYPDTFDGDNMRPGLFHSYKFKDITAISQTPILDEGNLCHSIQALTWRIIGLYNECCKEPDALVSEHSKVSVVEELIRLSHYVMDLSSIVHLMNTSSHFHSNFEEDLDLVVDEILPNINITIKENIKFFKNDPYSEAKRRAKETFKKFYFSILQLYGKNTQYNINGEKAKKAFKEGKGLELSEKILKNACQNLADFWVYIMEQGDVAKVWCKHVYESGIPPSQ